MCLSAGKSVGFRVFFVYAFLLAADSRVGSFRERFVSGASAFGLVYEEWGVWGYWEFGEIFIVFNVG